MKMNAIFVSMLVVILSVGCARVRVEAPKEPIKVDVSMRLDIYQHIEKDIDQIENMISGPGTKPVASDKQGLMNYFMGEAYAQEGLSPEVEAAALRRKDRRSELVALEGQGIIGENKSGLVEIRLADKADPAAAELVSAENSDRMAIYQSVAEKNGSSAQEVQRLYAKRLQADAPAGTPIEILNDDGSSAWKIK